MGVRSGVAVLLVACLGIADGFLLCPAAGLRPAPARAQPAQRVQHLGLRAATSQFGLGKLFGGGGKEAVKKTAGPAKVRALDGPSFSRHIVFPARLASRAPLFPLRGKGGCRS